MLGSISIKKTLQIDLPNRTEKTYLLNILVRPDNVYRCINTGNQTPGYINLDTRYYRIITSPTNSKGFISIRSSIDFFQENKADCIDKLRKYIHNSSKTKTDNIPIDTN